MATKADQTKFHKLQGQFRALDERRDSLLRAAEIKYGPRGIHYASKAEQKTVDALSAKINKVTDAYFALLDRVSPRSWHYLVSAWWVRSRLTWHDAITTGPLSTIPEGSYGSDLRELQRFAGPVR